MRMRKIGLMFSICQRRTTDRQLSVVSEQMRSRGARSPRRAVFVCLSVCLPAPFFSHWQERANLSIIHCRRPPSPPTTLKERRMLLLHPWKEERERVGKREKERERERERGQRTRSMRSVGRPAAAMQQLRTSSAAAGAQI